MSIIIVVPVNHPGTEDHWFLMEPHRYRQWFLTRSVRAFPSKGDLMGLRQFSELSGTNSESLTKCKISRYSISNLMSAKKLCDVLSALEGISVSP